MKKNTSRFWEEIIVCIVILAAAIGLVFLARFLLFTAFGPQIEAFINSFIG